MNSIQKVFELFFFAENLLKVTQPYVMARPTSLKFIEEIGAFDYLTRINVEMDCPMVCNYKFFSGVNLRRVKG